MFNKRTPIFIFFLIVLFFNILYSQSTISFIQISDTHIGTLASEDKLKAVLDDIKLLLREPVFIINTGDITDFGTAKEFKSYIEIVRSSDIKFHTLIGNHDVRWSNIGKKRFETMIGPTYYSFDYGEIHFILLDSGMLLEQYGHFSIDQLIWLKKELATVGKKKPIIICAHHPIFAEGKYVDNELEFLDIIKDNNIILYLCGHGHKNKTWQINGIDIVMTKAIKLNEPGYRIFEIYPNGELFIFTRDINTKKTVLEFKRNLKRSFVDGNYNFIAPNPEKIYNDNLPVLMTTHNLQRAEVSLDKKDWVDLQRKGGKYFQNLDIWHLNEGEHKLFLKYTTKDNIPWIEHIVFKIERGESEILYKTFLDAEIQATPVVDDGAIFIGTNEGRLFSLEQMSGKIQWCFATQGPITTAPALQGDTLFITSGDGNCYALDKKKGTIIWQKAAGQAIFSSPNYNNHSIYFGSSDSCLYALKSADGKILWKFKAGGHIKMKPAVEMNNVVFGAWDGNFYCISARDGNLIWKKELTNNPYLSAATSNPVIVIDKVYVNAHSHSTYCFKLKDGSILWEIVKSDTHEPGYSSPVNFDDKVVMGSLSGHLYSLSETDGSEIWTTSLADSVDPVFDSSPVIDYPNVIVGSIGGSIYGVNINTGEKTWGCKLSDGYIFSTPVVKDDIVYVGSVDGNFYAIKPKKN